MRKFLIISILGCLHFSFVNGQQANLDDTINAKGISYKEYYAIQKDVIKYFDLEQKFNTELKKEVFKKSDEYKEYIDSLNHKLKNNYSYYYILWNRFQENAGAPLKPNYNIAKKGFEIFLGIDRTDLSYNNVLHYPKLFNIGNYKYVYLKSLPTFQETFFLGGKGDYLFIPLSEEKGIEIEAHRDDILVEFYFKLGPISKIKTNSRFGELNLDCIIVNNVRVIIENIKTHEIYFNKSY